ncbi:trihelix transcription factor GT-2 [Neltuma alba]|uniref:trihelix transcription factor GT-2 n=1 Tax=Neltuma alba TaxID=207710 RepID=UPI0010A37589|nr:trihelix transcription factor GT-2-like [Prosopis alba]
MMQLGDPTTVVVSEMVATAAEAPPAPPPRPPQEAATEAPDGGGVIIITATSSGEGDNKMNSGGNRWPRQETLALLKIRSDMDSVFRDSSLKGPLWEEVSRKLGELGYQRSAKKCKEKFENVYKYHKRTKDSRSAKPEGKTKTYRFFDQLEAFESRFTLSHNPQSQSHPPPKSLSQPSSNNFPPNALPTSLPFLSTRPSDHSSTTFSYVTGGTTTAINTTLPSSNNPPPAAAVVVPNANLSTSTSSSTASDEDLQDRYRKKRKWKDYFRRLTRRVLARQDEMQKRFLDAIDKRERERVAQQEAWRMQEMARINREHEILVQERSTAAAKDAAIIAFLQKLSGGSQQPPPSTPRVSVVSQFQPQPQQQQNQQALLVVMPPNNNISYEKFEIQKMDNNNHNINGSGGGGVGAPSRWPKAEVHALIRLRTRLEAKYQENGPKAPLWEEISSEMRKMGYNRNAKRCKEKWENINKYFKKIKESNKQRREDSKTCPYFNELEAIYKEKTKTQNNNHNHLFGDPFGHNIAPLMVQPEQQWRPPTQEEEAARGYQECEEEDDDNYEDEGGVEEEDGGSIDLEDEEIAAGGGRPGGGCGASGGDDNGGYENINSKNKLASVDTVE